MRKDIFLNFDNIVNNHYVIYSTELQITGIHKGDIPFSSAVQNSLIMEFVLIKVILIFFGIILPSFDGYSDIILAYHLFSGTYWTNSYNGPKKQPIFGTMVLIPIILGTLFTIPHWLRRENTWRKRLMTFPLLISQFWPQWETFKVLRLVWKNDNKWKDEKEKLDKEISPLG